MCSWILIFRTLKGIRKLLEISRTQVLVVCQQEIKTFVQDTKEFKITSTRDIESAFTVWSWCYLFLIIFLWWWCSVDILRHMATVGFEDLAYRSGLMILEILPGARPQHQTGSKLSSSFRAHVWHSDSTSPFFKDGRV